MRLAGIRPSRLSISNLALFATVLANLLSFSLVKSQSVPDATPSPGAPPDMCSCYCCPSRSNPYGSQENCKNDMPEYIGGFSIGSPASCTSSACNVNFPVVCPVPPVRPPKGLTGGGAIRWGCKSGCRFGSDGQTLVNETARAPGIDGLDNAMYSDGHAMAFLPPYVVIAWTLGLAFILTDYFDRVLDSFI